MPLRSPDAEAGGALGRRALLDDLRERAFGIGGGGRPPRRIGAEVELIPVSRETRRMVPVSADDGPSTLPLLRHHAARTGWTEARAPGGAPLFLVPRGGTISYEPGGQVEFSSPACLSIPELVSALQGTVLPLREAAREHGIELLTLGIAPLDPVEEVPLRLDSARYRAMAHHFAAISPAGARMMRQTAAFQVNLDWEDEPLPRWRLLNAAAPLLVAIFANSPLYEGADTGPGSYRARVWRELDPGRTGLLGSAADPVAEYLDFALAAPAILPVEEGETPRPFAARIARGEVDIEEWWLHLTTLFPEVRPKGFAEVRSLDAVAPEWFAVPPTLLAGLVYDRRSREEASALLGFPDPALLVRAGERGLDDPRLARDAVDLFEIALRGAAALGEPFVDGDSLETARDFLAHYTRRGLSPADDLRPADPASRRIA